MVKTNKQYLKYRNITRLYCDNCYENNPAHPEVEMQMDNIVLMTSPPQYIYTCPVCSAKQTKFIIYPDIVEQWVDNDEYLKSVMD